MKKWMMVLLLINFKFVFSQATIDTKLNTVIPPSPNAAALGKFTETPVSTYTGTANVSIPIYEINEGRIKVPISLNYHTGGIRVEESSSWVGLGWSLNAGGMITRTVKGRPDDDASIYNGGYFRLTGGGILNNRIIAGPNSGASVDSNNWYNTRRNRMVLRLEDGEPDIFNVSAPGINFRFFYNQETSSFITQPSSKIKVELATPSGVGHVVFKITDQNGMVYTFSETETTNTPYDANLSGLSTVITSWMLTKIADPIQNREVVFSYTPIGTSLTNGVSDVSYYTLPSYGNGALPSGFSGGLNYQTTDVVQQRLNSISFNSGSSVTFNVSNLFREDLQFDKALKEIIVTNYRGDRITKATLQTSYFSSGNTFNDKRLKLDEVWFETNNNVGIQKYSFEYNDIACSKISLDQDEWGFYNGMNNTRLVKAEWFNTSSGTGTVSMYLPGGNRTVNENAAKMGTLTKLNYPTGGSSTYEYESNRVSVFHPAGYKLIQKQVSAGLCGNACDNTSSPQTSYTEIPFSIYNTTSSPIIGNYGAFTATIDWELDGGCPYRILEAKIVNANTGIDVAILNGINHSFDLNSGDYKLVLTAEVCNLNLLDEIQAVFHYKTYEWRDAYYETVLVGGLRVKQINTYDPLTQKTLKKQYEYLNDLGTASSGYHPGNPVNGYYCAKESATQGGHDALMYKRQSYSQIPLATEKGGIIGYSRVVEYQVDNTNVNGYTVYKYNDYYSNENQVDAYPFKPYNDRNYLRGDLTHKEVYSKQGTNFVLIEKTENLYQNVPIDASTPISVGLQGQPIYRGTQPFPYEFPYDHFVWLSPPYMGTYYVYPDKNYLKKTTTTTYDYSTGTQQTLVNNQDFDYSPLNLEVNKITTSTSEDSKQKITKILYPLDYFQYNNWFNDFRMIAIKDLKNSNNLNAPIEKSMFLKNGSSTSLLSGMVIYYNNNLLPNKIGALETMLPKNITQLTSKVGGDFVVDNDVKDKVSFNLYDSKSNLLEQQKTNDIPECFIWGYRGQYPVAKIVGTTWATANAVFNTAELAEINNPTSDANLRTVLQKLRTQLPNTFVTTYTYTPLIGITSETDPNNKTKYYEYDSFNRLKLIKDFNGNILKTFDYKYKQTY